MKAPRRTTWCMDRAHHYRSTTWCMDRGYHYRRLGLLSSGWILIRQLWDTTDGRPGRGAEELSYTRWLVGRRPSPVTRRPPIEQVVRQVRQPAVQLALGLD